MEAIAVAHSSAAGIISAVAAVVTALALVLGALPALLKVLKSTREVHVIVNQQRTDMTRYQAALIRALNEAGITVPIDQSLPDEDLTRPVK
jgi:hypothetical protein